MGRGREPIRVVRKRGQTDAGLFFMAGMRRSEVSAVPVE